MSEKIIDVNLPIFIYSSNNSYEKVNCICGNLPLEGDVFYYTSKYSGRHSGVVKRCENSYIISINGTKYSNSDIEIKPKSVVRDEKINKLLK
jgi:hypothetical protein